MDEVGLGKQLQKARQAAGLTQQELCQRAMLSYSTLAKIERGAIKAPSIFTIQSIAGALGVTLNDLLGITTKPPALPRLQAQNGVRFVYFDINGCLVRFFHRAFARLAEDTGATADIIEDTFWHYNDAVCRGDISLKKFNDIMASRLGVDSIDWSTYYLDSVDPITEMHTLVEWAADRYEVGLLSNIMPGLITAMQARNILPGINFTQIIDSSEVRAIKPEDRIYQIAQERAGVPPEEILLVDDSRANLMAAEHMGWHVLWFDDYRPSESVARIRKTLEPA
jgi:FMN phosphatase YigB (HAD superfamily)/DNA-binding XRE family transcriptional regulator